MNRKGYYCSFHNRPVKKREYENKCIKYGNRRRHCIHLIDFREKGGLEKKLKEIKSRV